MIQTHIAHVVRRQVHKIACCVCMSAQSLQSCPTLCNPKDYSPPDSSNHGILWARIMEWVVVPSSRETSWTRNWTQVSCTEGGFFTTEWQGKPQIVWCYVIILIMAFWVWMNFYMEHESSNNTVFKSLMNLEKSADLKKKIMLTTFPSFPVKENALLPTT